MDEHSKETPHLYNTLFQGPGRFQSPQSTRTTLVVVVVETEKGI